MNKTIYKATLTTTTNIKKLLTENNNIIMKFIQKIYNKYPDLVCRIANFLSWEDTGYQIMINGNFVEIELCLIDDCSLGKQE